MCTPLQLDKHAIVMKTGVNSGRDICLLPAGRETNSISFTKNELFFSETSVYLYMQVKRSMGQSQLQFIVVID